MFANRFNFGLGGASANAIAQFGHETTITTQLILNFTHAISSELRQYGQRSGCCSRELIGLLQATRKLAGIKVAVCPVTHTGTTPLINAKQIPDHRQRRDQQHRP
jgi:hypothetical protein